METESKFLSQQYIETRLWEIKEIKRGDIRFYIQKSNRPFSATLYVEFFFMGSQCKWFKESTLRISDHKNDNSPHIQFIVEPNAILTKKKKQQFMRVVQSTITKSKHRHINMELKNLSKEN